MTLRFIGLVAMLVGVGAGVAQAQVVTSVENGDTLVVDGVGRVRLLGIQHTDPSAFQVGGGPPPAPRRGPETAPPNAVSGSLSLRREQPARDLLRELALGKTVRIERDELADVRDRVYVFVDDVLVNAEMLRRGRARVDTSRAFARQQEFVQLQKDAEAAGIGIWPTPRP
jgi:endonuclease YncB( thermonuclease family)